MRHTPRRIRTILPSVIPRGAAPWESPGKIPETVRSTRRLPRRFAPRNDTENRTWCFCLWCGSGHPGRGGPTADLPEKNEKMSTEFENSVDKSRGKALASPSIGPISRRNRKKLHRLFKVCGDSVVPDFLLTLPEDLAILFMKSGATGSRFPTECYKK